MRLFFVSTIGLVATACSLSFNPDLPSGQEGGGVFENDDETGGDVAVGDGDSNPVTGSPTGNPTGMGGATHTCQAHAGAGGVAEECGGKP